MRAGLLPFPSSGIAARIIRDIWDIRRMGLTVYARSAAPRTAVEFEFKSLEKAIEKFNRI